MASLYDIGFNPRTMFIDEEGQIRLKNPEASKAMLAANEPTFNLNNYIMSTATKKQNNEPVFSNPGLPELEPSYAGLNTDAVVPDKKGFSLKSLIPFAEGSMSRNILEGIASLVPKMDPRQVALRDLYGYTNTGSVPFSFKSGLMEGYNPVSGGGLYTLTGGKFGEPPTYGLQKAYDKRMDTIEKTLKGKKYGLSQDDIDNIYAGTYDEESDNLDTTLIQRLRDLKAAKDKELQVLQSVTPGSSNDGYITFDGGSAGGGGGGGIDITPAGTIRSADNNFQGDSGPTTQQEADYGYATDYGFKRGGIVSIL